MATRTVRPGAAEWVPDTKDLSRVRAAAPECRGCELWEPATQVVFSAGNPHGKLALVGEQPGDVEDQQGIPFVGPAGRLLQECLDEAGVPRSELYVTNAVKHFRFEGRGKRRIHQSPTMAHITACRPWLGAELRIVRPKLVVVLGSVAAKSLLGKDFRVTQHRGEILEQDTLEGAARYLVTVHPSSVLRAPPEQRHEAREAFVADLRLVAADVGVSS
jgi:uracil-DNA glycosylase family protein